MIECVIVPRHNLNAAQCKDLAECIDLWNDEMFGGHGLLCDVRALNQLELGRLPDPNAMRNTAAPRDELLEFLLAEGHVKTLTKQLGAEHANNSSFLVEVMVDGFSPRRIARQLVEYIPKDLVDEILIDDKNWQEYSYFD